MTATRTEYTNLRIWDGVSETYRDDADALCVSGEKIVGLGCSGELVADQQVDAGGLTVVPGLIDAHVHLTLNPALRTPAEQLSQADDVVREEMQVRARQMVCGGITTARELGAGKWFELELRDAIRAQALLGPRLLCSGQPITSPGGHCHFWGGEAASREEALAVLERQIQHGVDLIKVMATGGSLTPGSDPGNTQFGAEILEDIVLAAGKRGYRVAAHCHGTHGIGCATQAGVTTIEHCSWVGPSGWGADFDANTAERIARKGIWVSPTINIGWKRRIGGEYMTRIQGNFKRMREAGVRFIASTDAGIPGVFHHQLAAALPVFSVFAGLSPVETLRSATAHAASALGLEAETGTIEVGKAADLLFVEGDPLVDLAALECPTEVFARGASALGALGHLPEVAGA